MPLRNGRPYTHRPLGVTDAVDGSNTVAGSMALLTNLIPDPSMSGSFVPRVAAVSLTSFPGFTSPAQITGLLVVGSYAYGMIAETGGTYNGKDVPFLYNIATNTFSSVAIPGGAASLPTTQAATGDWTPPILAVVGTRVVVTHPGFSLSKPIGWFDTSSFVDTETGNTHSSTLVDGLSTDVLLAGWQVGMLIGGSGVPANTTIISIASNGLSLVMSQASSTTLTATALSVAGGSLAAPVFSSGQTNGFGLVAVPLSVAEFNGRAYYAVANGVQWSDALEATQITNASQAITFANGLAATALGPLPLSSPVNGGIVQGLVVFQSNYCMQIITGDQATSNFVRNQLNVATGTLAPLTITPTNKGLAFVSPEGLRIIDFNSVVSDPIGDHGEGVTEPFIFAIAPSRMCAAANADALRISVQNGTAQGQPLQEWWWDLTRKVWTGPHTFPASFIQGYGSDSFLMVASGINAQLWQSDAEPSVSSTYTENGVPLQWSYLTTLFPDNDAMANNLVQQITLSAVIPPAAIWVAAIQDENGQVLDTLTLVGPGAGAAVWGQFNWGEAVWGGSAGKFYQHPLNWHVPLVFKQAQLLLTGASTYPIQISNLRLLYQILGYLTQAAS